MAKKFINIYNLYSPVLVTRAHRQNLRIFVCRDIMERKKKEMRYSKHANEFFFSVTQFSSALSAIQTEERIFQIQILVNVCLV